MKITDEGIMTVCAMICLTVLIILFTGDPDLMDALIVCLKK